MFLRRFLLSLARSGCLFLESASDTGSNSLAAFCCHSLAPLSFAIRRTSLALVPRTIPRNISLLSSLSSHPERSPDILPDDLVGHQAANCPKAGTPTW